MRRKETRDALTRAAPIQPTARGVAGRLIRTGDHVSRRHAATVRLAVQSKLDLIEPERDSATDRLVAVLRGGDQLRGRRPRIDPAVEKEFATKLGRRIAAIASALLRECAADMRAVHGQHQSAVHATHGGGVDGRRGGQAHRNRHQTIETKGRHSRPSNGWRQASIASSRAFQRAMFGNSATGMPAPSAKGSGEATRKSA